MGLRHRKTKWPFSKSSSYEITISITDSLGRDLAKRDVLFMGEDALTFSGHWVNGKEFQLDVMPGARDDIISTLYLKNIAGIDK